MEVCPILKKGNSAHAINYKPIILPYDFAKVFEMSLYNRIYPHIRSHSIYLV